MFSTKTESQPFIAADMETTLTKEQRKKDDNFNFKWDYSRCLLYASNGKEICYGEFIEQLDTDLPEIIIYAFLLWNVRYYGNYTLVANDFVREWLDDIQYADDFTDAMTIHEFDNAFEYIMDRNDYDATMKELSPHGWISLRSLGIDSEMMVKFTK